MAKKAGSTAFNMAAELRDILTKDRKISGKAAVQKLKEKFPNAAVKDSSALVAFSNARKSLGITKGKRKTVKKRVPQTAAKVTPSTAAVSVSALESARRFVSDVGGLTSARHALEQLGKLQVK
jgi:hypothetical protein